MELEPFGLSPASHMGAPAAEILIHLIAVQRGCGFFGIHGGNRSIIGNTVVVRIGHRHIQRISDDIYGARRRVRGDCWNIVEDGYGVMGLDEYRVRA